MLNLKLCSGCSCAKHRSEFSKASREPDGLQNKCKACNKAYKQANSERIATRDRANRSKINERARKRYVPAPVYNRPCLADVGLKLCSDCHEIKQPSEFSHNVKAKDGLQHVCRACQVIKRTASRTANPERERETQAAWLKVNKDRAKKAQADWYVANREYVRARNRAWTQSHLQEHNERGRRRRARVRASTTERISQTDYLVVLDRFDFRCAYCSGDLSPLEWDHHIPIARNGHHAIGNLVPSCQECNRSKGAKLPHEWLPTRLEEINSWRAS